MKFMLRKKNNGKIYFVTAHYIVIYYILVYHRRKCHFKEIVEGHQLMTS